jgi:hypothetical protein
MGSGANPLIFSARVYAAGPRNKKSHSSRDFTRCQKMIVKDRIFFQFLFITLQKKS